MEELALNKSPGRLEPEEVGQAIKDYYRGQGLQLTGYTIAFVGVAIAAHSAFVTGNATIITLVINAILTFAPATYLLNRAGKLMWKMNAFYRYHGIDSAVPHLPAVAAYPSDFDHGPPRYQGRLGKSYKQGLTAAMAGLAAYEFFDDSWEEVSSYNQSRDDEEFFSSRPSSISDPFDVNPTTGLPMVGDLDVEGNAFGSDSQDMFEDAFSSFGDSESFDTFSSFSGLDD